MYQATRTPLSPEWMAGTPNNRVGQGAQGPYTPGELSGWASGVPTLT